MGNGEILVYCDLQIQVYAVFPGTITEFIYRNNIFWWTFHGWMRIRFCHTFALIYFALTYKKIPLILCLIFNSLTVMEKKFNE